MPYLVAAGVIAAVLYALWYIFVAMTVVSLLGILWGLLMGLLYVLAVVYGGRIVAWILRAVLCGAKLQDNKAALAAVILVPPIIVIFLINYYGKQPFYESHWEWKSLLPSKVTNATAAYDAYTNCWHALLVAIAASYWSLAISRKKPSKKS